MTEQDRILERSIVGLLVGTSLFIVLGVVLPLHVQFGVAAAFVLLFAAAYAVGRAIGWRMAGAVVLIPGILFLGARAGATGGLASPLVAYFPFAAMAAWSWLGSRAGVAAIVGSWIWLTAAWWRAAGEARPASDAEIVAAYCVAVLFGFVFVRMVTSHLRAAADLAWSRAAAAERDARAANEAHEARDRLLAAVSYELRTPLDAALGFTALVREEEQDPERIADLDRMRTAGLQLLALVDDLLDVAQTGDHLPDDDPVTTFSVAELVDEVVATSAPLVAKRGNVVHVRTFGRLPSVTGHRRRIAQVLLNLLSNAAKYTTDGEIWVDVEVNGGWLRLAVRDTGIGIPAEKLDQLFQPFVQLHEGPERRAGIGLGLALAQRLAEWMGGRIEVDTTVGVGSRFTVRLPLRRTMTTVPPA